MLQQRVQLAYHPGREKLVNEFFARPAQPCALASKVSRIVMKSDDLSADADRAHIAQLCQLAGAPPPASDARHHVMPLASGKLTWERHTEFSAYTLYGEAAAQDGFDDDVSALLPPEWLEDIGGTLLCATQLLIVAPQADQSAEDNAQAALGRSDFAASTMRGGKAFVAADFRAAEDGFTRIFVVDQSADDMVRGRLVQRLLELDMYRLAALLALPLAQETQPALSRHEATLASLLDAIAQSPGVTHDRDVLQRLSVAAADIEAVGARTAYRFGAAEAYYQLVLERIERLREDRAEGRERLGVFITRRLAPAMRTCTAVAGRQKAISKRIDRATQLLATRVEVSVEEQHAGLLGSMERHAKHQLKLQQTVEGLSAIAITYYGTGIILYVAKGLKDMGFSPINPTVVGAIAAPLVFFAAAIGLKGLRRLAIKTHEEDADPGKDEQ